MNRIILLFLLMVCTILPAHSRHLQSGPSDNDASFQAKIQALPQSARITPEAYVVVFMPGNIFNESTLVLADIFLDAAKYDGSRAPGIAYEYTAGLQAVAVTEVSPETLRLLLESDIVASITPVCTKVLQVRFHD